PQRSSRLGNDAEFEWTTALVPICASLPRRLRMLAESVLDPLSRFVRKSLRNRFGHFVRMLVGRVAQKSDLLSVTATPFTEQEMNTQAKPLAQRKFAVECLRLQTGRRFAAR